MSVFFIIYLPQIYLLNLRSTKANNIQITACVFWVLQITIYAAQLCYYRCQFLFTLNAIAVQLQREIGVNLKYPEK